MYILCKLKKNIFYILGLLARMCTVYMIYCRMQIDIYEYFAIRHKKNCQFLPIVPYFTEVNYDTQYFKNYDQNKIISLQCILMYVLYSIPILKVLFDTFSAWKQEHNCPTMGSGYMDKTHLDKVYQRQNVLGQNVSATKRIGYKTCRQKKYRLQKRIG